MGWQKINDINSRHLQFQFSTGALSLVEIRFEQVMRLQTDISTLIMRTQFATTDSDLFASSWGWRYRSGWRCLRQSRSGARPDRALSFSPLLENLSRMVIRCRSAPYNDRVEATAVL